MPKTRDPLDRFEAHVESRNRRDLLPQWLLIARFSVSSDNRVPYSQDNAELQVF